MRNDVLALLEMMLTFGQMKKSKSFDLDFLSFVFEKELAKSLVFFI